MSISSVFLHECNGISFSRVEQCFKNQNKRWGYLHIYCFNNKMFSNLELASNSKSPTARNTTAKSKPKATKQRSYSGLHKQKSNGSELYNYEIAWICDHLYQGCFAKNKKHGEGLMIMANGVLVVGNWKQGEIDGYALFISPFGGKIHANYNRGELQGFTIIQYKDNFQILQFNKDVRNPITRRYDEFEQLWTEASYSRDGKLQKIHSVQKTKDFSLPSWIKDVQLVELYNEIIMQNKTKLKINKLTHLKVNQKFQYFGYVSSEEQKTPHGLGVIFSYDELYAGNFVNGSLDEYGLILFENGLVYKGKIVAGKIWGDGAIYDINLDETKCVRVCQQGVELVISQEQGFNLESVPFDIGKIARMPSDRGFSASIEPIFEQITKYYYRSNSTLDLDAEQPSDVSQGQQNQSDQYSFDRQSQDKQSSHRSQKRQYSRKNDGYMMQKQKLVSPSPSPAPKQKKLSNSGSLSISIEPDSPNSNKNNPYAKNLIKSDTPIIKLTKIPSPLPSQSNSHGIPSYAPSFQQISKRTNNKQTYPLYPYLMEFQMSKNVLSPGFKFSKIGKIVANSIRAAERIQGR